VTVTLYLVRCLQVNFRVSITFIGTGVTKYVYIRVLLSSVTPDCHGIHLDENPGYNPNSPPPQHDTLRLYNVRLLLLGPLNIICLFWVWIQWEYRVWVESNFSSHATTRLCNLRLPPLVFGSGDAVVGIGRRC